MPAQPRPKAKAKAAPRVTTSVAPPAQLKCPRCTQGTLIAGKRGWGCDRWRDGCRFVIWFETAGKRLTETQLHALITKGKTRKGSFRDARGNAIDGRLVLDAARDGGVHLERA